MSGFATVLMVWACVLALQTPEAKTGPAGTESLGRLSEEFKAAQIATIERARAVKPGQERTSSAMGIFDPGPFARRALEMARMAKDDAAAVDSLVWIIRHARLTPEHAEAIGQIEQRFLLSDRIAAACWPLASLGESGERILRRIVVDNPHPEVRGQACLGLTFSRRMLLRDVHRFQATGVEQRDTWIKAVGKEQVERLEKLDPAVLVSEAEQWLDRMMRFFSVAVRNPEVSDFFPILSQDLGPSAEKALRRAAEEHPDAKTRQEATCALLILRMSLAQRVAEAASDNGKPQSRHYQDVPGGADRISSAEPRVLTAQIDRDLRKLAENLETSPGPGSAEFARNGLNLYHLITNLGSNRAHHLGAERFLRRGAEDSPDERIRSLFRHSLALHLSWMADAVENLQFAAGPDLAYWEALLGPDRIKELKDLKVAPLKQEARALAEQLAAEALDGRRPVDRSIEAILRSGGDVAVGLVAPEIEGEDVDGKHFQLNEHRGRVVLLDFWNHSGCPPCRGAYPKLRALAKQFDGRPFVILGVNTDDQREELARIVQAGDINWRFWFRHGTKAEPTFLRWKIEGVPNVILLDHRGVVRARFTGTPSRETLEALIKNLVEQAEKAG